MNWRKTVKTLVLGAVAVAVYMLVVLIDISKANPGPMGKSFDGFLQSKSAPKKLHRVSSDGQDFLYVTGPMTPLWFITIPSGPPCYVFNTNGSLIDWTKDCGDDSQFTGKWTGPLKLGVEISIEEARREFQRTAVALSN